MKTTQRLIGGLAVVAVLGLSACSSIPVHPGFSGALNPILMAPACNGAGAGMTSGGLGAAAAAGERMREIRHMQSRFNLASTDVRSRTASWMRVVERGC